MMLGLLGVVGAGTLTAGVVCAVANAVVVGPGVGLLGFRLGLGFGFGWGEFHGVHGTPRVWHDELTCGSIPIFDDLNRFFDDLNLGRNFNGHHERMPARRTDNGRGELRI
jgi:hypothetical protein